MPSFLITGCSSGIGLEMARQLAARGEKVFATCRAKGSSKTGVDLLSQLSGDITVLEGIDVASDEVGAKLTAALGGVKLGARKRSPPPSAPLIPFRVSGSFRASEHPAVARSLPRSSPSDVVVHNAGSAHGTEGPALDKIFDEQKLDTITMDRMRAAFEVNTLGPLRVQQAVLPLMTEGGKVAVISTGIGSIGDNGSGGRYAYRTSKAGANMVTRSMAMDLKSKGIAVQAVAPGFVQTEFGPGIEMMTKYGAAPVDRAVTTIISVLDAMTLENTGEFIMVPTDGSDPKPFPW